MEVGAESSLLRISPDLSEDGAQEERFVSLFRAREYIPSVVSPEQKEPSSSTLTLSHMIDEIVQD